MRVIATKKSEQNRAAIDPWTFVHVAAGLALGLMNVRLRWALAASLGYELAEQVFERHEVGQDFFETHGPESLPNALVDTAVFVLGYHLGTRWNRGR